MALKPTIYKLRIALSDLDRNHYDELDLTVALHPSETRERMLARVLAFCLNAQEGLVFTRGLSTAEEPDVWRLDPGGRPDLWIEVGEPAAERLKKASRITKNLKTYSFNSRSETWWAQNAAAIEPLGIAVFRFPWSGLQALAALLDRTMKLSVTISDGTAFVATEGGGVEVTVQQLSRAG